MSDLDRSMHISLWVEVARSLFIDGSHMTKTTASGAYTRGSTLPYLIVEYLKDGPFKYKAWTLP